MKKMKILDLLSPYTSLYLLKQKRGQNLLGAFFTILFILVMILLSIYHIYIYASELEFNLTFYRDIWLTSMNYIQKKSFMKPKSFSVGITSNPNNATITLVLKDYNDNFELAEKCPTNPNPDVFINGAYCFNLSFYENEYEIKEENNTLLFVCEKNCKDPEGFPAEINITIMHDTLQINHKNKIPIIEKKEYEINMYLTINNDTNIQYEPIYTPILYNTTEKLNTKIKSYFHTQLASVRDERSFGNNTVVIRAEPGRPISEISGTLFASFFIGLNNYADIYIREYRTLLDTLSKIGGLFSPLKLLFELLVMFYSDLETHSEIAKNVFIKIKNYESKKANIEMKQKEQTKINLNIPDESGKIIGENNEDIQNKIHFNISKKNKEIRKKFEINKGEQYFCSFFNYCCNCCNFCKTSRTMKILNSCSDFVETYLSAENIIFNTILFENYYKNNYIKYNNNYYLNRIEQNIGSNILEDENKEQDIDEEKKDDFDKDETLLSLNND